MRESGHTDAAPKLRSAPGSRLLVRLLQTVRKMQCTISSRHSGAFSAPLTQVIGDHVECLSIMMHFSIQTSKVEPVENVFFVDFAKVLVAFRAEEPGNPG